jgi:PAS domain S-box-containing protein
MQSRDTYTFLISEIQEVEEGAFEQKYVDFLRTPICTRIAQSKMTLYAELFKKECTIKHLTEMTRELRHSWDQLDVILHGVTDGITVLDHEDRFLYANEVGAESCSFSSVEQFLSCSTAEVMNVFEILDEEGKSPQIEQLPGRQSLLGAKNPTEVLIKFKINKTGQIRWAIVNASPVFDDQGDVEYAVSVFREFTERRHIEETRQILAESGVLFFSSLEYKTILKYFSQLVVSALADWCIIALNEREGEGL